MTGTGAATTPEEFFDGHPAAFAAFGAVCTLLDRMGPYEVRVSRSQVAFWRGHGFAYLWMPGRYLKRPTAEVVLSIALGRRHDSDRFKEVVQVSRTHWMHHLEIRDLGDLDGEVAGWLREAADRAG